MANIEQVETLGNGAELSTALPDPDQVAGVYWSLNEAARQTGIPKGTLSKDASAGKIQWHPQPDGPKKFHAAEIYHVYQNRIKERQRTQETETARNKAGNTVSNTISEQISASKNTPEQPEKHLETAIELAVLKERLQAREEMIRAQASEIEHLRDQNQRITLMLAAPTTTASQPAETPPVTREVAPPATPAKKRRLWGLLGG